MERIEQKERVKVLDRAQMVAANQALASGGMVAFLVALALLFVVTGPS
jgi:hypothetical protein